MMWRLVALVLATCGVLGGCKATQRKPDVAPDKSHSLRASSDHSGVVEGFAVDGKTGAVFMKIASAGPEGFRHYKLWVQGSGTDKDWNLRCSEPELELTQGWCVVTGFRPIARTSRVRAVGSGTTFVLQIDDNVHRVYLLQDTPTGKVDLTSDTMQKQLSTARTFCEVYARGSVITDPIDLDEPNDDGTFKYPALRLFIDETVMPVLEQIRDQ